MRSMTSESSSLGISFLQKGTPELILSEWLGEN